MNAWRKSSVILLSVVGLGVASLLWLLYGTEARDALSELREPTQVRVSGEGDGSPGFDRYLPGIFK